MIDSVLSKLSVSESAEKARIKAHIENCGDAGDAILGVVYGPARGVSPLDDVLASQVIHDQFKVSTPDKILVEIQRVRSMVGQGLGIKLAVLKQVMNNLACV